MDINIYPLAEEVVHALKEKDYRVSTAESCTGGMMASEIVGVPGASDVLEGAFVTYSNRMKHKLVHVPDGMLRKYTEVSPQVAAAMAKGAAKRTGAQCGLSATGVAGPDGGTEEKPVGLVYIGCYVCGETLVRKCLFRGDREEIRKKSVCTAFSMLKNMLC